MRRILMCVFVVIAGCSFGATQGRSTVTYVVDDGKRPAQKTTVTHTTSGASIGGSLPIMMVGGGYGGAMNGPSCVLHPDRCAVIQTATVVQPMTIVSYGGGGSGRVVNTRVAQGDAGDEYDGVHVDEFDALTTRVDNAIPKLKAGAELALRQSCYGLIKDPSGIEDAAERDKIVASCKKLLAKKKPATTTPDAPADAGEEN